MINLLRLLLYSFSIICMEVNNDDYFCFLPINNQPEWAIYIVITALSLPLVAVGTRKFCRMRGSHNLSTTFVYLTLLLWWLCFVVTCSYSIGLYAVYEADTDNYSDDDMSKLSMYAFLGDWISTFIIQLLLIYIPYRWCKNITVLFNGGGSESRQRANSRTSSEFVMDLSYAGIETKIYPFLKWFIAIRFLELALPVVFFLKQTDISTTQLIFKIMMSCLLADSLIISVSLLLGMCSLKTSEVLKDTLDEEEVTRMFNQYLIISLASIIRFGFDVMIIISTFKEDVFSSTCAPAGDDNMIFGIVFMLAIGLIGDYFPVFIILRIYTLEQKPEQLCKSLIITTATADNTSMKLKTER